MSYPVMRLIAWLCFGWLWAAIIADCIAIWIDRPAVVYDDRVGAWRSARLVRRERQCTHPD